MKRFLALVLVACLCWTTVPVASAKEYDLPAKDGEASAPAKRTFVIGVFVSPPFVMRDDDGSFHGMAVDIWNQSIRDLDLDCHYVEYAALDELLEDFRQGRVDFILTKLVVTHERTEYLKYTYPWHDGGLRVMTKGENQWSLWAELRKQGLIYVYSWFLGILLVLCVAVTLLRRRLDPDFTQKWVDGLCTNLYGLVLAAKTGRVDRLVQHWLAYLLSVVWILFGLGTMAYITSTMTSAITAAQLEQMDIENVYDLPGKKVAVGKAGISEKVLGELGIPFIAYSTPLEGMQALLSDDVEAVVADSPTLEYFMLKNPDKGLAFAGPIFYPLRNAFAGQLEHALLVDRISDNIIAMYSRGEVQRLRRRYLGANR